MGKVRETDGVPIATSYHRALLCRRKVDFGYIWGDALVETLLQSRGLT